MKTTLSTPDQLPNGDLTASEKEPHWQKRTSPRRHWPLLRSMSYLESSSPSTSPATNDWEHNEALERAIQRSQSFQGVSQIGQALIGGFIVTQAMSMDLYHRRQRGAMDLTLPNVEGSNPFGGLNPVHAIVGAAVSQVVTDPVATYKTVEDCVGAACDAASFFIQGQISHTDSARSSNSASPRRPTISPRIDGITGAKKVRKYVGREQRIANSKAKKEEIKKKSIIHSL
jgi:hypothetical protein